MSTLPRHYKPRIRIRSDGFMFLVNDPLHEDLYFEFEICISYCFNANSRINEPRQVIFIA